MLDTSTILNLVGWCGVVAGLLWKWRVPIVLAFSECRGTGASVGRIVHIGEFSVMRRPSNSGSMRDRLDSIISPPGDQGDNALDSPDQTIDIIEMTSPSSASSLQAIIANCVSTVLSEWSGKKLSIVNVVSMGAALVPQIESLLAQLKQDASTETTQSIVTSVLTQILTNYATTIDSYVTQPVADLLQELLPTLVADLFTTAEDVKSASACLPCFSTSAVAAKPARAKVTPVHRLLAQNAAPPVAQGTLTVSSAPPTPPTALVVLASPSPAAAPVAAAGAPVQPIFFGRQ